MAAVIYTARLIRAFGRAYAKKWSFLAAFLFVFFASLSVLSVFDLLPDEADVEAKSQVAAPIVALATSTPASAPELPTKIEIPSLKLSATIANPETTDVELLDNALLKGAVRYPTSAKLGENGNVVIFGHSSYLPVVHNQAFKTFDGIQNLHEGDRILVSGPARTYEYEVETVVKADAGADAIPLSVTGSKLTIATCNSFGTPSDRFVVTANLVGSYPNAS